MSQRPRIVRRRRPVTPVARAPRRPGAVSALVIAASVALLTLAVTLALASLPASELTAGEAGPSLARLLALASASAGMFGLLVGILLSGDALTLGALAPAVFIGLVVGGLQAVFLLVPVPGVLSLSPWLLLPLALPAIPRLLGFGR